MRILLLATTALAVGAALPAEAQYRATARGGQWAGANRVVTQRSGYVSRPRWGGRIDNRWWGGMRAPGGWGAYRRPVRGWVLPSYWVSPNWYVNDWAGYGLATPPAGYSWSRYYDDAVLVDGRGSVYDYVGGVDWDRYDEAGVDYAYDDRGYDDRNFDDRRYDDRGYTRDRDGGLGGAAIGAVAGGVAGNLIGGRGNRLGGTLIGAGVGAAAGYAIDRNDRAVREYVPPRGRPLPPPADDRDAYAPGYGAAYPVPGAGVAYQEGEYGGRYAGTTYRGTTTYGAAYPPVAEPGPYYGPPPHPAGARTFVAENGAVVTTSSAQAGGGYYANGWYYPGATITTVTVQGGGASQGEYVEERYEARRGKGYRYTK